MTIRYLPALDNASSESNNKAYLMRILSLKGQLQQVSLQIVIFLELMSEYVLHKIVR